MNNLNYLGSVGSLPKGYDRYGSLKLSSILEQKFVFYNTVPLLSKSKSFVL